MAPWLAGDRGRDTSWRSRGHRKDRRVYHKGTVWYRPRSIHPDVSPQGCVDERNQGIGRQAGERRNGQLEDVPIVFACEGQRHRTDVSVHGGHESLTARPPTGDRFVTDGDRWVNDENSRKCYTTDDRKRTLSSYLQEIYGQIVYDIDTYWKRFPRKSALSGL